MALPAQNDKLRQIDIVKIFSDKSCLIIDDFPEIRGSLTRALKSFGARSVATAANGDEALKLCRGKKFDIVICDYNLGAGKDGQQVLEELRYLRVLMMTSLFLMITGEQSREMVLGALECQPDDYITKPYTAASLRLRLNKSVVKHQALLPIKKLISNGNHRAALCACNDMLREGTKYVTSVIKLKAHLHYLLKEIKQAHDVYSEVMSHKPSVWAKLGLAKTLITQGKFDTAEELLKEVVDEDHRYIEAHDMLAEIYEEKRDLIAAQNAIQVATELSPKSTVRHRKLARICEFNNDEELALKSLQQSIKWGMNSVHESEQDYFNYARKVAQLTAGDSSQKAKALVKQAQTLLDRARKRYANNEGVLAQADMVETQLLIASEGNKNCANLVSDACEKYDRLPIASADVSLDLARTLHASGDEKSARELLSTLAIRHANNPALLKTIDSITSEPISEEGKLAAQRLTKDGIAAYDTKDFGSAISTFNEALVNYPNHIGLHLNLIQAVCGQTKVVGFNEKNEALIKRSVRAIGTLPNGHPQRERQLFLNKQIATLFPEIT